METKFTPIAPDAELPHRKIIRSWLIPISQQNTFRAFLLLFVDYTLLVALLAGTIFLSAWWLKLVCALVAGFVIGRLFIIGHDACHQSLTPHRKLNKWIGRIAFLPAVSPYSLWDVGHNVVHHGFTNLKGMDFVWCPKTKEEYDALSPMGRFMERVYRGPLGAGIYYIIEIWWNRMMFPGKGYMGTQRKVFFWDGLLVSIFGLAWLGGVVYAAHATGQSVLMLVAFAWLIPLLFWFYMIGFVVYIQHTHTRVVWHDNRAVWAKAQPFVSTTVHMMFRFKFGALMHHIMEHTAHHVDMSIPLYKLKKAQKTLEDMLPSRIVIQMFSWSWYFRTIKACKLYNYQERYWTDFDGNKSPDVV
jgi:omega-6 fatty acid desaturase (delta-12 desaturase)